MLSEHTRFLASAIDSLDALVISLRTDGTVTQINRTCASISGYTAAELRGAKMAGAFFSPADMETVEHTLQQVLAGQGPLRCDAFFKTKSGEQRRISWTFAPLLAGSTESAVLVTGIDITEQFRALTKLNQLEALRPLPRGNNGSVTTSRASTDSHSAPRTDRRSHGRRPYSCVQSIAPCLDGKLPDRDQFRVVRCHDISPRGFSFLLATQPHFDDLVAAFGSAQSRLFLRSRVIHATPQRHEGRNVVLVGCEYTGRVRLPWLNPAVELAERA
jgi:PAS domain S-box-containing protein